MVCLWAYALPQTSMIIYGDTGYVVAVYSPSLGGRLMLSPYFLIPLRVLQSSAIIPCPSLLPIISVTGDSFLI